MLITFIGTRAQLIKMAPLLLQIEEGGLPHHLVFTGQHKETMEELLADFGIKTKPVYLYEGREITGIFQMMRWFTHCLRRIISDPDRYLPANPGQKRIILVHGDTFSTLLGAIAGKIRGVDVAHVEAGLRSYNILHPFPEELTRIAVFRLARYAFCPGAWAFENMKNYPVERTDTGENTLLDAVKIALQQVIIPSHRFVGVQYGVCSIHRFENIFRKTRLLAIIQLLEQAAMRYPMLFVLHPATKRRLNNYGLMQRLESNPRIQLLPRMGYIRFLHLIKDARFVVTDGGGNQEELSYMMKPTLLMRKATERKEGLGTTAILCSYDVSILREFLATLPQSPSYSIQLAVAAPSRVIYNKLGLYLLN